MIQMEFQTLDAVKEEDELSEDETMPNGDYRKSVFAQYKQKTIEETLADKDDPPARNHEARGQWQRLVSANQAAQQVILFPAAKSQSLSVNMADWMTDDLIDFGTSTPKSEEQDGIPLSVDVLGEPAEAIATSAIVVAGNVQPDVHLMDSDVYNVSFSGPAEHGDVSHSDGVVREMETLSVSSPGPGNLHSRSSSMRSTSSGRSEEGHSASEEADAECSRRDAKDEERGSPASSAYNRAFNKILRKNRKSAAVHDSKHSKPANKDEQEKLEHKARKDAKKEAKRLAEEAKKDAEREQRELRELANPIPESAMVGYKEHDIFTKASIGIHKLFHGIHHKEHKESVGAADAREHKLVLPRTSIFDRMGPSQAAVAVAPMRIAPRPTSKDKELHFATVESHQRDVPAWTMEEYMAKNARLADWNGKEDDPDFGGIEGNNLLNNYFADDMSDSDSDND